MSDAILLQALGRTENDGIVTTSELASSVTNFIRTQPSDVAIDHLFEFCDWQDTLMSVERAVDNWKRLLSLSLLNHFYGESTEALASKIYQFEHHPWNQNSQYFRALVGLNHLLAKLPVPDLSPHLLKEGAALIDLYEYCPWLSLPSIPHHLEYGIFLTAIALIGQKDEFKDVVKQIAKWQLNTLDANFAPLPGLFLREADHHVNHHLVLYYLLFKGVSRLTGDIDFEAISQKIAKQMKLEHQVLDPLWILLERLFQGDSQKDSNPPVLSEYIYDPSTALIGYRSARQHVVTTLHGNKTGLGSLRFDDVEIVNYGPQYLPLAECHGFGIEGNSMTDHGLRRPILDKQLQGFILKGCVRLVDQPIPKNHLFGSFRGIWLEVSQEFKHPNFHLETSLLGLDGWDGVSLSFFVKAKKAVIDQKQLRPKSFDRYEGQMKEIVFEGQTGRCKIATPSSQASMQVISLAGGSNFWGADFLVAYLLHPDQRHYEWTLSRD